MTEVKEGLSDAEAARSRREFGVNRITKQKRKGLLRSFLESFGDPMIKILLCALAVNVIVLSRGSNWFESAGIAVAILLATVVSTLSEYGSESAFERLQEEASRIKCRVRRSGALVELPVDEVVVGDTVLLQTGDRVPADGVMLSGRVEVDQSSLNGESREVAKLPSGTQSPSAPPVRASRMTIAADSVIKTDFDDPHRVFSGTIVCGGDGYMRVTAVGDSTFYGTIGAEVQRETRESPLKRRLAGLSGVIGRFGFAAAIVTALAYLFRIVVMNNSFDTAAMLATLTDWQTMLGHIIKVGILAVNVIVMAVPEGLPMMITVVLSSNMKKMLKDKVLVRKLVGIETAGSINILFTDKTGTLTKGRLEVTHIVSGDGRVASRADFEREKPPLRSLLHDAVYYNSAAVAEKGRAIGGNATDRALLTFVMRLGGERLNIKRVSTVPFTSAAKFMATTVTGGRDCTFIKGAPEKLLPRCVGYYDTGGAPVDGFYRTRMEEAVQTLAEKAVRVIAVAVSDGGADGKLRLVALIGLRDELRREAVEGVRLVNGAGIQTVMITGDARPTALAVARDAGLVTSATDAIITSDEMANLSDEQLRGILPSLRVVARALPSDKSRLVRIAQSMDLVVGMTGDGVNDAPALKAADVGFAIGSGTEVAKEASDIVILDDNFASIAKAVLYGRTIFKSIRKFIIYQMSICMCAVGVTVAGPLAGIDFPITVIQMLWINIVMDTLAGLAFSGELARLKYMTEPPKPRDEPIVNRYMAGQIAVISIYTTALCLFFLKSTAVASLFAEHGELYKLTSFFALFMFIAIFSAFCARTHSLNLFDYIAANKPFLWIMSIVTFIQLLIVRYGGAVFRTTELEPRHLVMIAVLAFTIIPVDMLRKTLSKTSGV